jgi:Na+/H+-translocating membrane pyrophosphatase
MTLGFIGMQVAFTCGSLLTVNCVVQCIKTENWLGLWGWVIALVNLLVLDGVLIACSHG